MSQLVLSLNEAAGDFSFDTSISQALDNAKMQIAELDESIDTIAGLLPECDKIDYVLAACSGALCGLFDIFLVAKPGASPQGEVADKWFKNRTMDFAKLCGWDSSNGTLASAVNHLEKEFKIPYDQRGMGDAASWVFDLKARNHHFKSLGHNPTLLGLFFSVLDQFQNRSHFISGGELLALEEADGKFELRGNSIPSKLFCGFANWFGHLISDVSGSSGSKTRGMGLPSPFWAWTNDLIAIKSKLKIPVNEFDQGLNELALNIYQEGFDLRFQAAQMIPIFINELLVRFIYAVRRMFNYFAMQPSQEWSFKKLWAVCEPFSNPSVKRMLTVAHGTFCLVDIGDATVRGFIAGGGTFNAPEFFMRLNLAGIGRFTISLYGEGCRAIKYRKSKAENDYVENEKAILLNYIAGLKELEHLYDDHRILSLIAGITESEAYISVFEGSASLAELRKVPEGNILKSKKDIDSFFSHKGRTDHMAKKESMLQLAQARAEEALKATNEKIEELGQHTSDLHDALSSIQEHFDAIRNIPSESKLEYEELKKIRIGWKQQARKIEDDYRGTTIKGGGAGAAGAAAGVAVVTLGPTAAMGIATTFGVASTGTAISTLSGAAATKAALAWLGGGALAAGGGGMAAGNALLALAGPVGWAIAGVALLSSGLFLWKASCEKKRLENVFSLISERDVTSYELAVVELNERIDRIKNETILLNTAIESIESFGLDYPKMTEQQQYTLGSYVNLMTSSTHLLVNPILGLQPKCSTEALDSVLSDDEKTNFTSAQKSLIVMLTNLLYKIDFNERDKKLLLKTFRANKKMLEAMGLTKRIGWSVV